MADIECNYNNLHMLDIHLDKLNISSVGCHRKYQLHMTMDYHFLENFSRIHDSEEYNHPYTCIYHISIQNLISMHNGHIYHL